MDPHARPPARSPPPPTRDARGRSEQLVAARGALVPGAARRAPRSDCGAAHAAAARPRPDRPLQGVPAPQAQDAGLRRARGRPLPHAADAHARGHADRAHGRARAAASTRTSPRRSGSATTSATRRSATSARRSLDACLRERFGGGFRHYEHSLRVVDVLERDGAGLNLSDDVRDGILCHSGRAPTPRDARGPDRADRRPRRLHQPRHRRRAARRRARRRGELPAERDRRARRRRARSASTRSSTTSSSTPRAAGDIVQGDGGRRRDGRAARRSCSSTSTSAPAARARARARSSASLRTLFDHYADRSRRCCPTAAARPGADLAQRVTDYLAGMTDRYCHARVRGADACRAAFAL